MVKTKIWHNNKVSRRFGRYYFPYKQFYLAKYLTFTIEFFIDAILHIVAIWTFTFHKTSGSVKLFRVKKISPPKRYRLYLLPFIDPTGII